MVVIRHGSSGAAQFLGQRIRVQRHQRRRRQARAPDPGAARHPDAARPVRADRGAQGRHLRRHPAQPGGAQQHLGADQARRARSACAGRPRLLPRNVARARRHDPAADRGRDPVGRRAQRAAAPARADAGGIPAVAARVQPGLRRHQRAAGPGAQGPPHPAPGPDESRRRDRQRRGRRAPQRDPAAGDQRRRRPDGGALSPGRRLARLGARQPGAGSDDAADPDPRRPGHRSLARHRRGRRPAAAGREGRGGRPESRAAGRRARCSRPRARWSRPD